MTTIVLNDRTSASTARIAVDIGFNCFEFIADVQGRRVDVIDAEPGFDSGDQRPSGSGIPILFPFPNRIKQGRYSWNGRDYTLPSDVVPYDATGNAIHGFCLDRPWRITQQTNDSVLGQFQLSIDAPDRLEFWPGDCSIQVRYQLAGPVLHADIVIKNECDVPIPFGFGTHPYFRLPLQSESPPDRCLFQAPVGQQWDLIDCLPTGTRHAVPPELELSDGIYFGSRTVDDVFTDVKPTQGIVECLVMDEFAGLQVSQTCDSAFREIVVYTPSGRNTVALEPYTCVTDALNLQQRGIDAGLRVLEPGEEFCTWIRLTAGLVIA